MSDINRKDIHLISRLSNWSEDGIVKTLEEKVYHGPEAWGRFLKLFLLGLGASFITFGILFFFAYNWEDLHKFVKLGLIEGLILAVTAIILFSKIDALKKNILLTVASLLVGVLMAVFGQIYQTGANAYDLFLGWTLLITLWVIVANFAPLWLLYLVLLNTTFILYTEQVANNWSAGFIFTLFLSLNVVLALLFILKPIFNYSLHSPKWLQNLLILFVVGISTTGVITGIFESWDSSFAVFNLLALIIFGGGIWWGSKKRQLIYISLIPFGVILIISAFLIDLSTDAGMLLGIGLFIVTSVSLLIVALLKLQRKWKS